MSLMSIFFTVITVIMLTILIVLLIKGNNYDEIILVYKLQSPLWMRSFNYICRLVLFGVIITIIYKFVISHQLSYANFIQLVFYLIINILNLNNIPCNYYVTERGILYYGFTKKIATIYDWKEIETAIWDGANNIKFNIIKNNVKIKLSSNIYKDEYKDVINYISKFVVVNKY